MQRIRSKYIIGLLLIILYLIPYAPSAIATAANLGAGTTLTLFAQSANPKEEVQRLQAEAVRLYGERRYDEAIRIAKRILVILEKVRQPDHPDIATTLNNLAEFYRAKNDYATAEPLYHRAIDIWQRTLGMDHSYLAHPLHGLAQIYAEKGEYAKAELMFQRALTIAERNLGPNHPDVAAFLNGLAELYRKRGDYAKAESLYYRAIDIQERAAHPGIARSLNNLGSLYLARGEYAKAEPLLLRSLTTIERTQGPEHLDVIMPLHNLASLYREKDEYAKAEMLLQRMLRIKEKHFPPDHPALSPSLNNLGELYLAKGDFLKAEPLLRRSLVIVEKALGPEHRETAICLHNLATLYDYKGNYAMAESLYQRALAIKEKILGPAHPDVATTLSNFAQFYEKKEDYVKAELLSKRALAILEKALGAEHPRVANSLVGLANLQVEKGDYAEAETLYKRALTIGQKVYGSENSHTMGLLNSLALFYRDKGDYRKAEPLFQQSLEIREKAFGVNHHFVATALNNLALYYLANENYAQAEPLFQRALEILEKTLGAEHPLVAVTLNNLATLQVERGDYAKAELFLQRSLEILTKAFGPDHTDRALALDKLASLYAARGDSIKAEFLFERSLAIREKVLGPEHPRVAESLSKLAQLYKEFGDYMQAEALYKRALQIIEKSLGPASPTTAGFLNNLALLYTRTGDYAKAEQLFRRALGISETALGSEHPDVATILKDFASLWEAKGDAAQAIVLQTRSNDIQERNITLNLGAGSERQKLLYLATFSAGTNKTISLHVLYAPNDPAAQRLSLTTILRRKGRALDAMTDSIGALRRRLNPQDQTLLDQLATNRSGLATHILRGPGKTGLAQYQEEIKRFEKQVEKLESLVSVRSAEFRAQSQTVTIEAVQSAIPPPATLVEFMSFYSFDPKTSQWGTRRYVVYVLNRQGEPRWADLGEAEAIDDAIKAWRGALRYPNRGDVKTLARVLDEKLMQPVRKLLGESRMLLLSPDGALNLIPFAALVDEQDHYLIERYSFIYLTTGRDLLRLQTQIPSKQPPMIIADPDFDAPGSTHRTSQAQVGPSLAGMAFKPLQRLAESAPEAMALKATLPGTRLLMHEEATEESLKRVSGPAVLHVATHGFFLEDETSQTPQGWGDGAMRLTIRKKVTEIGQADDITPGVEFKNPLLRSGLFLAGANRGKMRGEDGILTALEAAGLDLWGTKLVVLSACDTGVGEVRNGEGVYGLRRALVLAGSESQVMSLWPVSDAGTRELMEEYYKTLQAGQGRSEALRQVQLRMIGSKNRRHPYFWASFVHAGAWETLRGKP